MQPSPMGGAGNAWVLEEGLGLLRTMSSKLAVISDMHTISSL